MKKIGMIGVGNMGGAILRGMIASGYVAAEDVMACLHSEEKRQALAAEIPGLTCTTDAKALAQECRMIVLAVKPQVLGELLDSIKGEINDRALVSIAAGWTMDMLTSKVAGTTATCRQTTLSAADLAYAQGIFDAIGETAVIDEKLFDGFIAVSGSSPAYIFMLIEAMADAAVREGIRRPDAVKMAAQAVLGSAKMVLETGKHPGQLKDEVCSPAGTTIEAVAMLEKRGFRAAVQDAMAVCAEKSRQMSK